MFELGLAAVVFGGLYGVAKVFEYVVWWVIVRGTKK